MNWKPIDDFTPIAEPVLVRDHSRWTLAKRVFLEWSTLAFAWPPIQTEKRLTWVLGNTSKPLDFTPTEWCRVDHGKR